MQALHTKKLEQALRSHERFPVNLEWMVDVFKYKHISSLTTHLKRHFKMNIHYRRFAQEQNKRVWTYFISVECFIGICEYVRHAARKKIANMWLRKVGAKRNIRRRAKKDYGYACDDDDEEEEDEEEEEEDDYETEEEEEEEETYMKFQESRKDRMMDDEEYLPDEEDAEEDDGDDSDERASFNEEIEDEFGDSSSSFRADSDEEDDSASSSVVSDYDSPSTPHYEGYQPQHNSPNHYATDPAGKHNTTGTLRPSALTSSGEYSSPSPPSSPDTPRSSPRFPDNMNGSSAIIKPTPSQAFVPIPSNALFIKAESSNAEQVDWSYLNLRPSPPALQELSLRQWATLTQCSTATVPNVLAGSNTLGFSGLYYSHLTPTLSSCIGRQEEKPSTSFVEMTVDDPFDTNMFLSFPSEENMLFC